MSYWTSVVCRTLAMFLGGSLAFKFAAFGFAWNEALDRSDCNHLASLFNVYALIPVLGTIGVYWAFEAFPSFVLNSKKSRP